MLIDPLVVNTWLAVFVYPQVLKCQRRIGGYVHKRQRGDGAACVVDKLRVRLLEPLDYTPVNPVFLAHKAARVGVSLLVFEPPATVKEPQQKLRRATDPARVLAVCPVYRQVIVGYANVSIYHALRARIGPALLTGEQVRPRKIVSAVVIAVRRCPCQASLHKRCDNLVNVDGAILVECVIARDKVAIEYDEVCGRFGVEDRLDNVDRLEILLGSPDIPRIC